MIGKQVTLDGITFDIVGVMGPGFAFPGRTDIWISKSIETSLDLGEDEEVQVRSLLRGAIAGRLRPGVTLSQAKAEVEVLFERLKTPGHVGRLVTLRELAVADYETAFVVLLAGAASLLLIGVANGANIQLVRATQRQREIAIRICLGATRWQLMRLFVTEGLILALLSGSIGVFLAHWGVTVTRSLGQAYVSQLSTLKVNSTALGVALLVSLITSLLVAIVPFWQMVGKDPAMSLACGGYRPGTRPRRTASVIAVVEVALAVVLIVSAGLAIQTLFRVTMVSPGFDPRDVIAMRIDLPVSGYASGIPPSLGPGASPQTKAVDRGSATEPGLNLKSQPTVNPAPPIPFNAIGNCDWITSGRRAREVRY